MKQYSVFLIALFALILAITCKNAGTPKPDIDPVTLSPGIFKVLLNNEHVRVIAYTLQPSQKDEWHTHPAKSSYVVSGGRLKVFLKNGETILADEKEGTASWMDYVGEHYVENIGSTTVKIVYTEIK